MKSSRPTGPDPGALTLSVRSLQPSATVAINERSDALIAAGRQVIKLGLGQSPFPVPAPVVRALADNAFQKDYLAVQGLLPLREAVAAFNQRTLGIERSAADVLIGPGSKELMFILQLAYQAELLLPNPSWVSYAPQASIIGRPVSWLATTAEADWKLLPGTLHDHCIADPSKPRILLLNYPNNPTGVSYTADELEELAEVARRFGLLVLADEIYAEVHHGGGHTSIARYYEEGTVVSGGLSKWCGAGGWRLGTFVFPQHLERLRQAMTAVASETYTSTSAPIQYAAVTAFQGGPEIDSYLKSSRRILNGLASMTHAAFTDMSIKAAKPEGAFYILGDFEAHRDRLAGEGIKTSSQLCLRMLDETGVAALAGSHFGRPAEELTVRFAFVDFDGGAAIDALPAGDEPASLDFLNQHCGRVQSALTSMASWIG